MSFAVIIHLSPADAGLLAAHLAEAQSGQELTRLAIDDGGVKLAVGRWSWTPPIGRQVESGGGADPQR
jgi:hypothetical protein